MTIASEVLKKPIQLDKVVWPVFRVGTREPKQQDGVTFLYNEYADMDNVLHTNISIIDDKNIDKTTLGLRRLNIDKDKLYSLSISISTLQDLIKLAKPNTWFIDSAGQLFTYKKTTRAKLATHKIIQILPVSAIGCVLEVEGFSERFKSVQIPVLERYAGILTYNSKNLLYGLYTEKIKPTWRLV